MNNIGANVVPVNFKQKEIVEYRLSETTYIVDATILLPSGGEEIIENIHFIPFKCFVTDVSSGEDYEDEEKSDVKYIEARNSAFIAKLAISNLLLDASAIDIDLVKFSLPYIKDSEEITIGQTKKTVLSIVSK
ncbi:hypothetical protein A9Q91_02600 [Candidatus Gracilibacteria bacterium 28_42_T64]|nr:hypothetical protein A9Q91_02600 [Candidatus Gracilibacteria bacterium 28_42_T64]